MFCFPTIYYLEMAALIETDIVIHFLKITHIRIGITITNKNRYLKF